MNPTPQSLDAFFLGLASNFWQGYNSAPIFWNKIAMLQPSTSSATLQGWMDKLPIMRKWIGSRVINSPQAHKYRIENDPYEETVAIDKWVLQDDEHGLYAPVAQMMGVQASKWPDRMLRDLLAENAGDGPICWDQLSFFNTAHPVDVSGIVPGTFSNKLTLPLTPDNYQSARAQMMTFKGADGEVMGTMPTVLVVPPELELTARNFLNASFIAPLTVGGNTQAGANQNVLLGSADLVVIPELSPISATRWYLLAGGMPIKPFIFQQRQAPFFVYKNRPDDESMFWNHQMVVGAEARGGVGVSLPQLAIASQP